MLRCFLSLGAPTRTDATTFVSHPPQDKHRASQRNGFTLVLSGISLPSQMCLPLGMKQGWQQEWGCHGLSLQSHSILSSWTVLLGVHRGGPTAPLLLLPGVGDAPSPTWGRTQLFLIIRGVGGKGVGPLAGLMGEAAQGWGFGFSVSWALPRSRPCGVCTPWGCWTCLDFSAAATSAGQGCPWDKSHLGGFSLMPLQPRYADWGGLCQPAAPAPGQAMVRGDL